MNVKSIQILRTILVAMTLAVFAGCTSLWSLQCSKDEIMRDRVYASGNRVGIRALQMGASEESAIKAVALDNGAGIGVDVSNWSALSQHPVRQLGAAILDAGMTYGAYLGAKALVDSSNKSDEPANQTAGRDIIQVVVDGRNNTVNVGDKTDTTTTTTPIENAQR